MNSERPVYDTEVVEKKVMEAEKSHDGRKAKTPSIKCCGPLLRNSRRPSSRWSKKAA